MDITITLTGTQPLLMHNERLANPLDPLTKALKVVSSKRSKTEDDMVAMARIEFEGGLYLAADGSPMLPTWNIKRSFVDGGKANKLGTHVMRSFTPLDAYAPLIYDGPKDVDGLWSGKFYDTRMVKVGMAKIARTRPRFDTWAATFAGHLDTEALDVDRFVESAFNAGRMVGIGDFRQQFGRYTVEVQAS